MGEGMSMEVGPHGFLNNSYFPQNNSSVISDKKGLSWHFLSWYRSCTCYQGPSSGFGFFLAFCVF